ncbi:hypothetical protein HED55_25340 [Ochrobactrum haematophilum]|uniref:Uncharacterized protein n=1 Tax=Brucella haematophila TaxID=419474 RepID=A0ABX1DVK0_9HYPH|nr:hypothetical protein [Brucella haematophila]
MIDNKPTHAGMKPMTGLELQAARRAAADRFYQIGMSYVPEGYTVKFRKRLTGVAYGGKIRRIEAPRPVTRKKAFMSFYMNAHTRTFILMGQNYQYT